MKYTEKYGFLGRSPAFRFVSMLRRTVVLPMFEWVNRDFKDVIRMALLVASLLLPTALPAQCVQVRYHEGLREVELRMCDSMMYEMDRRSSTESLIRRPL
jgi:hypothetical protein